MNAVKIITTKCIYDYLKVEGKRLNLKKITNSVKFWLDNVG